VGYGGTILRTTNGGTEWTSQSSGTLEALSGVSFTDSYNGTAVGDRGTILRTTNGGTTWTTQFNYTNGRLSAVDFVDSNNGTVVSEFGTILRTTDGGTTWASQSSGTTDWLEGVSFTDANNCTAVGDNGIILRTTNAGTTWISQSSGTTEGLYGVSFTDSDNGTAVGYGGTILRTTTGGVIPVELTAFTASISNSTVTLNWATATETNNQMFEIERSIEDGQFVTIGNVEGHGTTTEIQNYQYIDNISDLQATSLSYRLKQIDYDGSYEYSEVVEVKNLAPTEFALHQNYPNPFNPVTTIRYSLPVKAQVELIIYNALGESVTQLVNEEKEAGRYEVKFDAAALPSGIYFYKLKAGSFIEIKKMVLMK